MSSVLSKTDFGPVGFRWLTLKRIKYKDPQGRERFWESAERTTRFGEVDGVAIVARVHSRTEPLKVVLESQYRPPQDNFVVELPAGLVDAKETAAEAAVRELREETGYSGTVAEVSPVCFSDPGMTNANMQVVVVDVDADAPENADVKPELEDGEFIDVFLLPFENLYDALLELQREKKWDLDARLLMYAQGLVQAQSLLPSVSKPPCETTTHALSGPAALPAAHAKPESRSEQPMAVQNGADEEQTAAAAGSGSAGDRARPNAEEHAATNGKSDSSQLGDSEREPFQPIGPGSSRKGPPDAAGAGEDQQAAAAAESTGEKHASFSLLGGLLKGQELDQQSGLLAAAAGVGLVAGVVISTAFVWLRHRA